MGLFNSISLVSPKRSRGLPIAVRSFIERVESDSGEVESVKCLVSAIKGLPIADQGRVIFDSYALRVSTDLGITEARNCTITEINNLHNV